MSEPVSFYSGVLGWVRVISISNPVLLRPGPSKADDLITSDSLLKLIFIPLAFFVLYLHLCHPSGSLVYHLCFLFSIFLMLWHLVFTDGEKSVPLGLANS